MNELSEDTKTAEKKPPTPYELLGGEEGLRQLVGRFYEIMDEAPEAADIRAMHKPDLGPIRQGLFEYLSGWLGGPPLYVQRTGSVCLNGAHSPFAIGEKERDQWMFCLRKALVDVGVSEELRGMLDKPFFRLADFLRNQ